MKIEDPHGFQYALTSVGFGPLDDDFTATPLIFGDPTGFFGAFKKLKPKSKKRKNSNKHDIEEDLVKFY